MLRWSLIFIFAFLIVSIQSSENALPLNFFVATNSFEYMEIGTDGKEVPTNRDDKILMVGTDFGKIVGSAQSYCRHINPPAEQTILIKPSELKHYPFEDLTINKTKQLLPIEDWECAAPHYGCLTLVHNYCSFPYEISELGLSGKFAYISKNLPKLDVGKKLKSAYLDENGNLRFGTVTIKDFKECEKHFDPENLYLVDKDEQICTDRVYRRKIGENRPIDFSSGLLFYEWLDKYHLVGIESKSDGGLSLSTFAPYHCHGFEHTCSDF